jgi:DNA-binding MarR family transcriptional regulator
MYRPAEGKDMIEAFRRGQEVDEQIVLGLLESVERDGARSQRKLAAELGIALGLVNAYLKRCVTKGLVKIKQIPTRRYAYYLTPKGFAEKSRLTVEYLTVSFEFFRRARGDCANVFSAARQCGWKRIALLGISDLAEIATICAPEADITITAVVDANASKPTFVGIPVLTSLNHLPADTDGVVVTDVKSSRDTIRIAVAKFGIERVLAPALLGIRVDD